MKRHLYHSALWFGCGLALLLPFPWQLLPFQQHLLPSLFGSEMYVSDSRAQLLFYGILGLVSLLTVVLLLRTRWYTRHAPRVAIFLRSFLLLYVSAVLFRYGADKLFKTQFYLPEPTLLYTPLGMLEKDSVYWSLVGSSRPYNLFLGGTEVLAGLLLLFRRGRRAGILLALSVFIQVLAIDACFGITVRLFAATLLVLVLLLALPDLKAWAAFLSGRQAPASAGSVGVVAYPRWLNLVFLIFLAAESLAPALRNGNWNDDTAPRPPLHGAYEVLEQPVPPPAGLPATDRILVHRAGFFVLQDHNGALHPMRLQADTADRRIQLEQGGIRQSFSYRYQPGDSLLILYTTGAAPLMVLRARALNWRQLPLLR